MRVITSAGMRELDRIAMEEYGIPGIILMENAGRAVAEETVRLTGGPRTGQRIVIFCGPGNNGGDGLVAARHLYNRGYDIEILFLKPPALYRGDALANYYICHNMHLPATEWSPSFSFSGAFCVIDALLGTGIRGEVAEPYRQAIDCINDSGLPTIAVDMPSGLDADTGNVLGRAVRACSTVTMGIAKTGLVKPDATPYVGNLIVAEISLPRPLVE